MRGDTGKGRGQASPLLDVPRGHNLAVSRELAQKFSPEGGEKIIAALKRATRAHVAVRCGAVKAAAHLDLERSVRVQRIRSELVYFRWPGEGQQTSSSRKADGARTRRLER